MRVGLACLWFCLVASMASAQTTIHQYPYDPGVTAYPNADAWPLLSAQCHWRPANSTPDPTLTPQLQSPAIGHTHMEVHAPIYAEVTQTTFTVPFDIMLFHVAGAVSPTEGIAGPLLRDTVWDTNPTAIVGDPNGLMMWSGHVTIDLKQANGSGSQRFDVPKHGWFTVEFGVHTFFDSGDQTRTTLYVPFYSMLDPSAPEQFFPQNPGAVASSCGPGSARDNPADAIGLWQIVQYNSYLPILAPITYAIDAKPGLYGYGTVSLPDATGMTRFDMDLHHGNAGTFIQQASAPATTGVVLPSPFEPAILGLGVHKVAAIQQQDSGRGSTASDGSVVANEQATALLVVTVNVTGNGPPPIPIPMPTPPAVITQMFTVSGVSPNCVFTVQGTSADGGRTFVLASPAGTCQ